jgi:hypothetical protein
MTSNRYKEIKEKLLAHAFINAETDRPYLTMHRPFQYFLLHHASRDDGQQAFQTAIMMLWKALTTEEDPMMFLFQQDIESFCSAYLIHVNSVQR